jgi:hypothetical protein
MDDHLHHKIGFERKRGIKKNTDMENPKQARICFSRKPMNVKQIFQKKIKISVPMTQNLFKVQTQQHISTQIACKDGYVQLIIS